MTARLPQTIPARGGRSTGASPESFAAARAGGIPVRQRAAFAAPAARIQDPTDSSARRLSGKVGTGMLFDYYNRVFVLPPLIEVQNPRLGQPQPFNIWNAFLVANQITAVAEDGAAGLVNTAVVGQNFRPVQLRGYSVTVTPSAPVQINATYTFTFQLGSATFRFNASRATVLGVEPEMPIEQVLEYETDIFRSYDGSERRFAIRGNQPRQQLNYQLILETDAQRRALRLDQFINNLSPLVFPLWQEPFLLTQPLNVGETAASGDFTFADFLVGDNVYLVSPDGASTELNRVDVLTPTLLTLRTVASNNYPAGSAIFPTIVVQPSDGQTIQLYPVNALRRPVRGRSIGQRALGGAGATVNTYQGLPILEQDPSANDFVDESFSRQPIEVNFGGAFNVSSAATFSNIGRRMNFFIRDRQTLQYWKRFLDMIYGRREPFYMATNQFDVIVTAHTIGTSEITIENEPDLNQWLASAGHNDLQIILTPGEVVANRRINAVNDNNDGTLTLALDQVLPDLGPSTSITKVSLLELTRLASDVVRFRHFTTNSVVSISTETIEA